MNTGTRPGVRGFAERRLGVLERFERFLVAVHDAQCGGDADPGVAVAVLIDREIECFAVGSECIVRASELQQQLAEQQAALVQQDRFTRKRARLVDEAQRAFESQRCLLDQRRVEICRRGAFVLRCGEMVGAQRRIAARVPLGSSAVQLAPLRLQSRFVDGVAEQRVYELQVGAVEAHQRGFGQCGRIVVVVAEYAAQRRQRRAMSKDRGGL